MLTKDLITNIAASLGWSKTKTEEFLSGTVSVITQDILNGDAVQLQGFGTLYIKQKGERIIVHPRTKERSTIPAKQQLSFKPTATIKEELK